MPPPASPAQKISHRLKMLGVSVLAVGLTAAAVVLCTVRAPVASSRPDEALPPLDSKVDSRALEENQGAIGLLLVRFREAMQEPGPLALVIAGSAILVSLVCFRTAGWISSAHRTPSSDRRGSGT
jgi:hypothetical protein